MGRQFVLKDDKEPHGQAYVLVLVMEGPTWPGAFGEDVPPEKPDQKWTNAMSVELEPEPEKHVIGLPGPVQSHFIILALARLPAKQSHDRQGINVAAPFQDCGQAGVRHPPRSTVARQKQFGLQARIEALENDLPPIADGLVHIQDLPERVEEQLG